MSFVRKQKVTFLNPYTGSLNNGVVVGKDHQPFSYVPIIQIRVTKGPEKGTVYWVPEKDVDDVLGFLARQ